MASNKFIKLTVKMHTGTVATLYLGAGNFAVAPGNDGVKIYDGTHNPGGWKLDPSETYDKVVARIDQAIRESEMPVQSHCPGYKD